MVLIPLAWRNEVDPCKGKGGANFQRLFMATFKSLKKKKMTALTPKRKGGAPGRVGQRIPQWAGQRKVPGFESDPAAIRWPYPLGQEVDRSCLLFPVPCTHKD